MSKHSLNRKISALCYAIATTIISIDLNIAAKPVRANIIDLVCPVGAETATYSPGLTNYLQQIKLTLDGAHTTCQSLDDPTIKSATYNFTGQVNLSCQTLTFPPYDIEYNFNNGKSSTVHYVSSTIEAHAGGKIVLTSIGDITSREFAGDMVTRTVTDITPSPAKCFTTQGVTSITGAVTLTFSR